MQCLCRTFWQPLLTTLATTLDNYKQLNGLYVLFLFVILREEITNSSWKPWVVGYSVSLWPWPKSIKSRSISSLIKHSLDVLNNFGNVPLICCVGSAMNKILTQGQTELFADTLLAISDLLNILALHLMKIGKLVNFKQHDVKSTTTSNTWVKRL